jgi:phage-related minor tail protein
MPLAGYAGTDVFTNFNMCVTKSFHDYAGLSMDGMNAQMGSVSDSLGAIGGALSDMRGMFGNIRSGFMMVFQMVFGKIHNLMASMQYLMIRIRTLIGRIVGVFAALIYSFYAGEQTGESVWKGPIGEIVRIL